MKINQIKAESSRQIITMKKSTYYTIAKRLFDFLFALCAVIFFSPIMFVIAIFIKIKSPEGSIIFKQKRLGLNGNNFYVYKFRTMIPNAENELKTLLKENRQIREEYIKYRKLKNDIRIIKGIGHFIRKTSLDELPQFFNVIRGDMSIVGPRPYIEAEFYKHPKSIIKKITSVKPGITGYWQVLPSRHNTTFEYRIKKDIEYIQKKNFLLDLKIILQTIKVMFLKKGA